MCKKIINIIIIFIITIVVLFKTVTAYAIGSKEEIVEQNLTDNYTTKETKTITEVQDVKEKKVNTEINDDNETKIYSETEKNTKTQKKNETIINNETNNSINNESVNSNISEEKDYYPTNDTNKVKTSTNDTKVIDDGTYIIRSYVNRNYVLDVREGSKNNEANIQLYNFNNTDAQKFYVKHLNNGYYEIKSIRSGKVLDVKNAGKVSGTNIWQYEINGTDAQKWLIKKNTDNTYSIISKLNNLYVDVVEGIAKNEQNIQVYSGNATKAQKFVFEKYNSSSSNNNKEERIIEDGTYTIKSSINKEYALDVSGGSKNNGANIQLYISNNTNAQKFNIKYLKNGYYEIESVKSGKVLDVEYGGRNPGTNIWQYESNGTDAQKWIIKKNEDKTYSIISKLNNLYIDISEGKARNEQNIQVYTGNKTNAQKFIFEKTQKNSQENSSQPIRTIENGTYIIKSSLNENYVLDVAAASKANGANIQLYSFNGTSAQKFKIKYLDNGYYSIVTLNSNKSIDVKEASKNKGANVWQWEENGTDAQKWIIQDAGSGYYNIISKCNGLYLDVNEAVANNGTNIQVYNGNRTNAQKFKFLKADSLQYSEGTYGQSGLKIQKNSNGSDLKYYKYGSGANVFFATFAIHGWEDDFANDGKELTKIADLFKYKLISMNDKNISNKWTIYIFPSVNPDGEYHGWSHNGPGRTTLYSDAPEHRGIDMNRTWSTDWVKYASDRNYTGTEPFQAFEARSLRDFLLSHKATNGQTVLVDLHGWLNETMGDDGISLYYRSTLGMSKHISSYGRGYLINWARANLGSNGRTARSALIELPEAHSSADVNNWGLADKYINATINMLRSI